MSTSSSDSAETQPFQQPGPPLSTWIHDRVVDIANQSGDRCEFLKSLGAELRENFNVAIVAIHASHWPSAMMLVTDDLLAAQIDRSCVKDLLASASATPIACDVPVVNAIAGDTTRGLRVELTGGTDRASVLLVYSNCESPPPITQVDDLKQLAMYAQSTRSVAAQLPIPTQAKADAAETGMTVTDSGIVNHQRDSLRLFHLDLDLRSVCYRIANESRRLLRCDRTTVLIPQSGKCRVQSISGVAVVDRRSNSVRAIERLTQSALVMSRPMILPCEEPLPPQIQQPLDDYLDESGVMGAILLPLHAPDHEDNDDGFELANIDPFNTHGEVVGVIVLEYFSGTVPHSIDPATRLVASEATLSLRNSLEHQQVFGLTLWKSVGALIQASRLPWVLTASILMTLLLVASMIIQVEHHVIATGHLEPSARREVFSTVDGVVKALHVQDGQSVVAGDLLVELENAELQNQAEKLAGEIQTASQRLASIKAVRLSNVSDVNQSSRMALEERQLESELANLLAQQTVVQDQQQELRITSPIDGSVIAWQMERRLTDRPVSRGNLLLSVADHSGPWTLKLNIPDHDAGPVLEAVQSDPRLAVEFAVATRPEDSFAGVLHSVATAARMDDMGRHVIDVTADVTADRANEIAKTKGEASGGFSEFDHRTMRVGADVTAKIACGKRSVLRSWFSDVFDFVDRNVLFYL